MLKKLVFGAVLPFAFVAIGVGIFIGMKRPQPRKNPPLGTSPAALLSVLPIAEVKQVRALSDLSETLDIAVTGNVVPYRELELAAEVSGRIIEKDLHTRSGNYVEKGQLLYKIDPRDYELAAQRLSNKYEQEQAALRELEQEIANTKDLITLAREEVNIAEAEVKRYESLGAGFSSRSELDQARRSRLAAMNQVTGFQNQLRTFQSRSARLELAIKTAATELEQAKIDLARTVIQSPVDGRIVSEHVETDSFVQRGTQLVVIEDTEKVEVVCNVRMDQLYWILDREVLSAEQLVSAAQAARFQLPQLPVKVEFSAGARQSSVYQWQGKLDRFDGAGLNPQSRTVPLRIVVDNPSQFHQVENHADGSSPGPPMLVRGMFVDVTIHARPSTPLLLVPKLSIKPASDGYRIWRFLPDEKAMHDSAQAIRERALAESQQSAAEEPHADAGHSKADVGSEPPTELPDPAQWQAGYLQIIDQVEIVNAMTLSYGEADEQTEFSVCRVPRGSLSPQDWGIVTPLPGIKGDGSDPVRVAIEQMKRDEFSRSQTQQSGL